MEHRCLVSTVLCVCGMNAVDDLVSVPVSRLPQLVYETKQDLARVGLTSTIVGHVGDGNFHALILFRTDEELAVAKEAVHRMVKRAISLDGTCKSPPWTVSVEVWVLIGS